MSRKDKKSRRKDAACPLGATPLEKGGVNFCVWAPYAKRLRVQLIRKKPILQAPLVKDSNGHFRITLPEAKAGDRYWYILDDEKKLPDPASRLQPEGVHGPSEVIDPRRFHWTDSKWRGIPLEDSVIYELHVGTFTSQGTFQSAIRKLDYLKSLGVLAC